METSGIPSRNAALRSRVVRSGTNEISSTTESTLPPLDQHFNPLRSPRSWLDSRAEPTLTFVRRQIKLVGIKLFMPSLIGNKRYSDRMIVTVRWLRTIDEKLRDSKTPTKMSKID